MKIRLLKLLFTMAFTIVFNYYSFAQWWDLTGTNATSGDYIGTANSLPMDIKTIQSQPVNFYTNYTSVTTPRMLITNGGNVGIGTTGPAHKLDVNGDVNIASTYAYYLNSLKLLSVPNSTSLLLGHNAGANINSSTTNNTFVGYYSGNATTTVSASHGQANTFTGYYSGKNNTIGSYNTFIGTESGRDNTINTGNTFVGYQTGKVNNDAGFPANASNNTFIGYTVGVANTSGYDNTFVGKACGVSNTTGYLNSFLGVHAGHDNTEGFANTYLGRDAGYYISTGDYNLMAGFHAGQDLTNHTDNNYNVMLGALAGQGGGIAIASLTTLVGYNTTATLNSITNATAIGANATVSASNNLILGSSCNVGIGVTAASQKLHVNGTMRLTGSDGTAITVMGRDADGDVSILGLGTGFSITSGTLNYSGPGSGTVTYCASPGPSDNYVTKWTDPSTKEICNSIIYDDGTRIGISDNTPTGKLNVANNSEDVAGNFVSTNDAMTDVIVAYYDGDSDNDVRGITSYIINGGETERYNHAFYGLTLSDMEDHQNYGGYVAAIGDAKINIGLKGAATNAGDAGNWTGENKGIEGYAADGETYNYGGYFFAESPNAATSTDYGVWASAVGTTHWAAYFIGAGYISGGSWTPSDMNLKENIQDITNNLEIINQLRPKKYEYRTTEYPFLGLSEGENYGLIAEDVQIVLPGLIRNVNHPAAHDSLGNEISPAMNFNSLNYTELIPFLIGAIKEQQQQIDHLNSRVNDCCGPGIGEMQVPVNNYNQQSTLVQQELNSFAKDLPVLSQNQPNPFSEKTTLRFYLPKGTNEASIKVYDNTGSVYRLFALTGEGPGTIELEGNTLAAGNYYYSLLIGGNVIDTKTMVITK